MPKTMNRVLYQVAPVADQCDFDEDGQVSQDLYVWAKNPSEAVKLWLEYYDRRDDGAEVLGPGVTDQVRVFEVPIMPEGATSTAIGWGDVREYAATETDFVECDRDDDDDEDDDD